MDEVNLQAFLYKHFKIYFLTRAKKRDEASIFFFSDSADIHPTSIIL